MPKYDYHQDKEIADAAEKYDKVSGKEYDAFILEERLMPVPFYDLSLLATVCTFPIVTGLSHTEGVFLAYRHVLDMFFKNTYNYHYKTDEEMEWGLRGLQEQLYGSFKNRLVDHLKEYNKKQIIEWLCIWKDVTISVIEDCFEETPFSLDIYNHEKDNLNLLRVCFTATHLLYIDDLFKNYHPVPDIICYNFWGDQYIPLMEAATPGAAPTREEAERNNYILNILRFSEEIVKRVHRVLEKRMTLVEFREFIQILFSDYTKLLRIHLITEPVKIEQAVIFWESITRDIIKNVLYVMSQHYRLCDYHLGDCIHPVLFRSSHWEEWNIIHTIKSNLDNHIRAITVSFMDDVKNGKLDFRWAAELNHLHLDYHGIYSIMKDYFTEVPFLIFRYCIESANLSYLQNHLIDTEDSYGALRFLVFRIGANCKLWLETASGSLKDANGKPYNSRTFNKSVSPQKKYAKKLIDAFDNKRVTLP